jgi:hypothetical protein
MLLPASAGGRLLHNGISGLQPSASNAARDRVLPDGPVRQSCNRPIDSANTTDQYADRRALANSFAIREVDFSG